MGRGIPDDVIEEIRIRSDIVDVIGSYIQLKRAGGNNWKACCPFHNEKTPSFHVRGDKQLFHCFGCGKGGDVFRFVMERENVPFPEAAHLLATRAGVIIPEAAAGGDRERSREIANTRDRLYRLNEAFAVFFETNLREHPEWPAARYLATRRLSPEAIARFRLGAAPDTWDGCLRHGRSLGFSDAELLAGGIVRKHEPTGRLYDHFKGRLTFAIWNEQGRVVGFSARSLEAKPQTAKYVNTAETAVFHKGNLLYALPFARQAMQERGEAILCEGQLDTIAFHRAGLEQAVAPQGTGFTGDQARILRRYANRVVLAFDADAAGQKAIRAALELLLPLEFDVRALRIPGGKDPDELFAAGGAEAVNAAVAGAESWIDYLADGFETRYDLASPAGRGAAVEEIVNLLLLLPNPVVCELSVRAAAERLQVREESVLAELRRRRLQQDRRRVGGGLRPADAPAAAAPAPAAPRLRPQRENALLTLLELALGYEEAARQLADELPHPLPDAGLTGRALEIVVAATMNGEHNAAAGQVAALLTETPDERIGRLLASDCSYEARVAPKALADCLRVLRQDEARTAREQLLARLRAAADPAEKSELLAALLKL